MEISSDLLESEKKDGFRIPEFMKLVFSWDDEDLERTISLPIKRLSSVALSLNHNDDGEQKEERVNFSICFSFNCFHLVLIRLMKETTQELRHVSQIHRRDDLRTFAYSALDVAAGVINEYVMALNKLKNGQAWQHPLQFAELENPNLLLGFDGSENNINALKWKVQLIDETGKIPFRKVKDKNLEALFAAMVNEEEGGGLFDEDDGRPFLDCLRDWEDEDDEERDEGAEDDFYEDLEPKYFTPGRRVSSFDEFGMIRGFGFSIDDDREPGLFNEDGTDTLVLQNSESSLFTTKAGLILTPALSSFFRCSPVQMIPCLKIC